MVTIFHMATGERETVGEDAPAYGDDVLCAGWPGVPRLGLQEVAESRPHTTRQAPPAPYEDVADFLARMYAAQRA